MRTLSLMLGKIIHGPAMMKSPVRTAVITMMVAVCLGASAGASAAVLPAEAIASVKAATFEVVIPKPDEANITYDQPINFDLLPFSYRNDKYISIGTAFALPGGVVATAAHVLDLHHRQLNGIPKLRDAAGNIYEIGKIVKYAYRPDFVVFTLKDYRPAKFLDLNETPQINSAVFAVGNALGEGIVIRDGAYTSNTPETQDGKWNWLRFSAAASPGNSGGPLLDGDGKVIGIVVAKSENENLNYALPIAELLHAPDNLAVFNSRGTYKLPNMEFTYTDICNIEVKLPLTAEELRGKLEPALDKFNDGMLASLFAQHRDEIFPQGQGSQKLLFSTMADWEPIAIMRSPNGEWGAWKPPQQPMDLGANGFLSAGQLSKTHYLMRLRKPDGVELKDLMGDAKKFMDMLLKVYPLERNTGYEKRRVISLGYPQSSHSLRDKYGRVWNMQSWNIPYMDRVALVYSAPTPEGAVILLSVPAVQQASDYDRDAKTLIEFVHFIYQGTLAEWRTFLAMPEMVPDPLRTLRIDYEDGKSVNVRAADFTMRCGEECMSVSEQSRLGIGFSFDKDDKGVRLRTASAGLLESSSGDKVIKLMKILRPPQELGESFGQPWHDASKGLSPFDGEPIYRQGYTTVTRVLSRGKSPNQQKSDEDSRFVMIYLKKGEYDKKEFKRLFAAVAQDGAVFP